jgi:hypothetical protein
VRAAVIFAASTAVCVLAISCAIHGRGAAAAFWLLVSAGSMACAFMEHDWDRIGGDE